MHYFFKKLWEHKKTRLWPIADLEAVSMSNLQNITDRLFV